MRTKRIMFTAALITVATGAATGASDAVQEQSTPPTASAGIYSCSPGGGLLGFARLFETPSGEGVKELTIAMLMTGLTEGKHGVHIHELEDTFCPQGAVPGCAGGSRVACGIIMMQ